MIVKKIDTFTVCNSGKLRKKRVVADKKLPGYFSCIHPDHLIFIEKSLSFLLSFKVVAIVETIV